MAIKAVTKYQSDDGTIHDDIVDARKHDSMQRALAGIRKAIALASPQSTVGTLSIDLLNYPEKAKGLRDALNKVLESHRLYGKLRKEPKPA